MTKSEAIELLRKHSRWMAERWLSSPEGTEYKEKFDSAIDTLTEKRRLKND